MKKVPVIVFFILGATLLYFSVVRPIADRIFCERVLRVKIANFKTAAFRLGVVDLFQEDEHIKKNYKTLYTDCLRGSK